MNTIDHRRFTKATHRRRMVAKKQIATIIAVVFGIFIGANILMTVLYRDKALPNSYIGSTQVGGKDYDTIEALTELSMLPKSITVTYKDRQKTVTMDQLGVQIDQSQTMQSITTKPMVPVWSLVYKKTIPVALEVNDRQLSSALDTIAPSFTLAARNKHVVFQGSAFKVADASKGYKMDIDKTRSAILHNLAKFNSTATAVVRELPAGDNNKDLGREVTMLQKYLQTPLSFTYGSQKIVPSKADIGKWFADSGDTMVLSGANINEYVTKLGKQQGITVANQSDLALAIQYAVPKQLAAHLRVSSTATSSVRTYCVAAKGVSADGLADLRGKLALTYADLRGWNANGALAFRHVDSGCAYTVWLTAPSLMTSFGTICDDFYNCQVGTNVIVNSDRWQHATEPWLRTGQDIETYRLLIINHETGHRIGFRDNNVCSGSGQLAPVMMQQSIDLKGCVFNVWPLPSELANLKSML